jgi:hypothetical protein
MIQEKTTRKLHFLERWLSHRVCPVLLYSATMGFDVSPHANDICKKKKREERGKREKGVDSSFD